MGEAFKVILDPDRPTEGGFLKLETYETGNLDFSCFSSLNLYENPPTLWKLNTETEY